ALEPYNLDLKGNLSISKKASLIIPTHRLLDAAYEQAKGDSKIGSTLRGIGPTYKDKVARQGLRVGDILSADFKGKYEQLVASHRVTLDFHNYPYAEELAKSETEFFEAVDFLRQFRLT